MSFRFFKRNTDPKSLLHKVLGDFQLPSFPDVVLKTLEKIRDPNADAHTVARVLAKDPSLTVKVLKTVNSAAFSPVKRIENLQQAIALMGLPSLESLVLSMGVNKALPNQSIGPFQAHLFWLGSARRAYTAEALSEYLHPQKNIECFTEGLLQDMAVPLLATRRPKEYGPILEAWSKGKKRLHELEKEVFGWDHAEVATWMCAEWDFPESLAAAIGGHNQKDDHGPFERPAAIHLVSLIKNTLDDPGTELLIREARENYGLAEDLTRRLLEENFVKAEELVRIIA